MENKKRKLSEDDTDVSNTLKTFPCLLRTFQAIEWINHNPFKITDPDFVYGQLKLYIQRLFSICFSGMGFGLSNEYISLSQHYDEYRGNLTLFNFTMLNKFSDRFMLLNFSMFIEYLETKIIESFISVGLTRFSIMVSMELGINFQIIKSENDSYDLKRSYDLKNEENIVPEDTIFL